MILRKKKVSFLFFLKWNMYCALSEQSVPQFKLSLSLIVWSFCFSPWMEMYIDLRTETANPQSNIKNTHEHLPTWTKTNKKKDRNTTSCSVFSFPVLAADMVLQLHCQDKLLPLLVLANKVIVDLILKQHTHNWERGNETWAVTQLWSSWL